MTKTPITAIAMLALFGGTAAAQDFARIAVPDSRIMIEGTSNLHGWACRTASADAVVELDASAATQLDVAPPRALRRVDVKVPVKSLKCGRGAMDNNLYKALNADKSPEISYIMASFEAVPGDIKDSFSLKTVGTLTVNGTERRIAMDVVATRLPDGTVHAKGVVPVKMTDFGITPPTALFGRLKTGDEIKVNFELTVGPKAIAAATTDK